MRSVAVQPLSSPIHHLPILNAIQLHPMGEYLAEGQTLTQGHAYIDMVMRMLRSQGVYATVEGTGIERCICDGSTRLVWLMDVSHKRRRPTALGGVMSKTHQRVMGEQQPEMVVCVCADSDFADEFNNELLRY